MTNMLGQVKKLAKNSQQKRDRVCVCVCVCVGGGGVELSILPSSQKGRGLTGSQFFEGGCWEKRGDLFQVGSFSIYIRNDLKSGKLKMKKNL